MLSMILKGVEFLKGAKGISAISLPILIGVVGFAYVEDRQALTAVKIEEVRKESKENIREVKQDTLREVELRHQMVIRSLDSINTGLDKVEEKVIKILTERK